MIRFKEYAHIKRIIRFKQRVTSDEPPLTLTLAKLKGCCVECCLNTLTAYSIEDYSLTIYP
jgi:hypothetical protein